MALPAVLLKAKDVLGKAKVANDVRKSLGQDGSEDENSKLPMGCIVAMPICAIMFLPMLVILLFSNGSSYSLNIMHGVDPNKAYANTGSFVNVVVGEAANILGEAARIEWLYDGNGVPETEEENELYLESFPVKYLDLNGNEQTINLKMHKKLKAEVQAIFQDMVDIGFKLEWSSGGGSIRGWNSDLGYSGTFYRSAHCYGHAIDINVNSNYYISSSGSTVGDHYLPGSDPLSVTEEVVNIWKAHGFYWGGDWNNPKDYMHFSYFNH